MSEFVNTDDHTRGAPSPLAGEGVGRRPTEEGSRAKRDGFGTIAHAAR
jgi:hypothetical protein